jgi:hypothetical protein
MSGDYEIELMLRAPLVIPVLDEERKAGEILGCHEALSVAVAFGLRAEHFHDPRCGRVLAIAPSAPPFDGVDLDGRVAWFSERAGIEAAVIRRWLDRRTVLVDSNGAVTRRIIEAAEERWERCRQVDDLLASGFELVSAT